jgi:hypothetical protein
MMSQHAPFVKLKRNNPKSMDFCLPEKEAEAMPWDSLWVNLISPLISKAM